MMEIRMTEEEQKQREEFERIKSEIPDLKIAHTLSNTNPLKKFLYGLENQEKPGKIYKGFCLLVMVYLWTVQGVAFYQENPSSIAMLPLTLSMTYIIYVLSRNIVNKNETIWDCFDDTSLSKNSISIAWLFALIISIILAFHKECRPFIVKELIENVLSLNIGNYSYFLSLYVISFFSLIVFNNIFSEYEKLRLGEFIKEKSIRKIVIQKIGRFFIICALFLFLRVIHCMNDKVISNFLLEVSLSLIFSFAIAYIMLPLFGASIFYSINKLSIKLNGEKK